MTFVLIINTKNKCRFQIFICVHFYMRTHANLLTSNVEVTYKGHMLSQSSEIYTNDNSMFVVPSVMEGGVEKKLAPILITEPLEAYIS